MRLILAASVVAIYAAAAQAEIPESLSSSLVGRGAFLQPLTSLNAPTRAAFRRGEGIFAQAWLVAPSAETPRFDGLGPLFNRRSCIACHAANGRGEPPRDAADRMRSMLVRLSVPGQGAHGAPRPEPVYGDQLQTESIPDVAPEGEATVRWTEQAVTLGDGTAVSLRRPEIVIRNLSYGPFMPGTMTSARVAPPVFGLGLLAAVPVADLAAHADPTDRDHDGIRGRINHVWDAHSGRKVAGRFGAKANQPDIAQQTAAALAGDMGITSARFPREACMPAQTTCARAPNGGHPEIPAQDFSDLVTFIEGLAPPARRGSAPGGERLFAALGCAACHVPALRAVDPPGVKGAREIHPYSDLLIHDMGEGLADHRPDFEASGSDWRTAPLWGLGLTAAVTETPRYLHDGRAGDLTEAVLWHGGEAARARDAFAAQPKSGRDALLAFLETL
jgi:CxxC motif-containing protein (DUF1111 family)